MVVVSNRAEGADWLLNLQLEPVLVCILSVKVQHEHLRMNLEAGS